MPRKHQHTPGPWRVEDWQYRQVGREHVPTIQNDSDAIAEVNGLWRNGADDTEERNANARLIAAAPDLLAAACTIVEWRDLIRQNYPDMQSLIKGMNAAAEAIAKATGEV